MRRCVPAVRRCLRQGGGLTSSVRAAVSPVAGGGAGEKSLELWLTQEGRAPVSLGVLPQTGEGPLVVPGELRARLVQGAVLSVSAEPAGSAPGGKATGPILASGAARFD